MAYTVPCYLRIWIYKVARILLWKGDSRPKSMYRRSRPVVEVSDNEILYMRWFNDYFDETGRLRPANIFIPDQSMNRNNLGGRSWHVLIPEPNDDAEKARKTLCRSIICFQASHVTLETRQEGFRFEFRIEHDPLDHNYGHCELRLYRDSIRLTHAEAKQLKKVEKKAWTLAKKWFRAEAAKARDNQEIRAFLKSEVGTKGSQ